MNDTYLAHHGIRGMKWGIRRFENFMGRLTPAGKKRYGKTYKQKRERIKEFIQNRKAKHYSRKARKTGSKINKTKIKTLAKAGLTAAATYKLYKNPKTRHLASKAAIGGAAITALTAAKIPGFKRKQKRYEKKAKRFQSGKNRKRSNSKLRTAAKVAGTAALVGGVAYALHKTGALKTGMNAVRNMRNNKVADIPKTAAKQSSHAASRAIINANRNFTINQAQSKRRKEAISNLKSTVTSKAKEAAKRAVPTIKEQARSISTNAKKKASTNIKSTLTKGIDEDNPDTWLRAYSNAKEVFSKGKATIDKGKRYYNAVKLAKNVDILTAASTITPNIIDATNAMLKNGNEAFRKFQNSRKRKDI